MKGSTLDGNCCLKPKKEPRRSTDPMCDDGEFKEYLYEQRYIRRSGHIGAGFFHASRNVGGYVERYIPAHVREICRNCPKWQQNPEPEGEPTDAQ